MRRTMTRERLWQEIAASLYTLYGDREEFEQVIFSFNHLAFPSTRAQFMESKARRDAKSGKIYEAVAAHSYLSQRQWRTVKDHLLKFIHNQFPPAKDSDEVPEEARHALEGLNSLLQHIENMDCWPEFDRQIPWLINRGDDTSLIRGLEMSALGCSIDTLAMVYKRLSKSMIEQTPDFPPVRSSLDDELGEDPDENTITDLTSPLRKGQPDPEPDPEPQPDPEPENLDESCIQWGDEPSEDTEDEDDLEKTDILDDIPEGAQTQ